jgi:hypothetical protein
VDFLQSSQWVSFVMQVFDNSIGETRCCDGVRQAMESAFAAIIQPEQPQDFPGWYLCFERQLDDYCRNFLGMFDFHLEDGHEEGTYGGHNLRHRVNPLLGFSSIPSSQFLANHFQEGRHTVLDCLLPFKTGNFVTQEQPAQLFFYGRGHKKNASNRRIGNYKFVHIAPFSPVTLLYRYVRSLFGKQLVGGAEKRLSRDELGAFEVILRLCLSIPAIRDEYTAFIAPGPDIAVSPEQDALWNVDEGGIEPSMFAVRRNAISSFTGTDEQHAEFNRHLKYWKLAENSSYFYPSFETCKRIAAVLGYAQWRKGRNSTDLMTLQLKDSFPVFDVNEDKPADRNPPPQAELYNLQLPHGQPVPAYLHGPFGHGVDQYYIDKRQSPVYKNVNVWGESIDGQDVPKQPVEPYEFELEFTREQIDRHADPVQKALYRACYLSKASGQPRTIEKILQELDEVTDDLRQWRYIATARKRASARGVDLTPENADSERKLSEKYPGDTAEDRKRNINDRATSLYQELESVGFAGL